MTEKPAAQTGRSRSKTIRSVALPVEHGGWGFLLEPILLGLIVAPTFAGFCLSIAASGAFLLNQPLQLTVKDWLKRKRYPRTVYAERFAAGYGLLAALALALALLTADAPFWPPILLATPLALIQIAASVRNRDRYILIEIAGAAALGAVTPAILLAAGSSLDLGLALWAVLITRSATSILYVRTRLRLEYGEPANPLPALAGHVLGIAIWGALALNNRAPWTVPIAMMILFGRAALGVSSLRKPRKPQIIGAQEMIYGVLVAILTAIGYR